MIWWIVDWLYDAVLKLLYSSSTFGEARFYRPRAAVSL